MDGDTRQCPQCRDTLVFSSRYPVLAVGIALQTTGRERARIRYERAWVCRNGGGTADGAYIAMSSMTGRHAKTRLRAWIAVTRPA